jgi:hypothetical protein
LNDVEVAVRYDHSHAGFQNILNGFEALDSHLDELKSLRALEGSRPETVARIERAKELVYQGASLARKQLGVPPP